jgi:hypothetical protein
MARRRSAFRKIVVVGILVLAGIGALKLYNDYKEPVSERGEVVYEKAKRVKKILEEDKK